MYQQDVNELLTYYQDFVYPCYLRYIQPSQKFADRTLKNENIVELFQELDQEVARMI